MSIELGKVYRDRISGFTGTATARATYLSDAASAKIEAETGPTSDAKERWINEDRLEPVDDKKKAGFAP